jgi:alkylated DNA repair dioxygenase AlkB
MFTNYENSSPHTLVIEDGQLDFFPNFLDQKRADDLFQRIKKELPFQENQIVIFGRQVKVPRLEAYFSLNGENYGYSGQTLINNPFPKFLDDLRLQIEAKTGCHYNALLINYYRDGQDSNGWHADNEKSLGKNPSIASLSLGAERNFELRHLASKKKIKLTLTQGSLLHMHGALQHHWKHQLPKVKDLKAARINLTFRLILAST